MNPYVQQMSDRLTTVDRLFQRLETFQYQLNQFRETLGLTPVDHLTAQDQESTASISTPKDPLPEMIAPENPAPVREDQTEAITPAGPEDQDAYQNVDIDALIQSMDLGIQL